MLSPIPQNPLIWTDCLLCLGFFPGLLQMVLGVAGKAAQGQASPRVGLSLEGRTGCLAYGREVGEGLRSSQETLLEAAKGGGGGSCPTSQTWPVPSPCRSPLLGEGC